MKGRKTIKKKEREEEKEKAKENVQYMKGNNQKNERREKRKGDCRKNKHE